jgi:hypothetical protein
VGVVIVAGAEGTEYVISLDVIDVPVPTELILAIVNVYVLLFTPPVIVYVAVPPVIDVG